MSNLPMLIKSTEEQWREENQVWDNIDKAYQALDNFGWHPNYEQIRAVKFYVDQVYNKYIGRKDVAA